MCKILVTNDDSLSYEGIKVLASIAKEYASEVPEDKLYKYVISNGNYIWQYGDYSGYCVEAWRHLPLNTFKQEE